MKVAFLGPQNCIHTVRWANEMAVRGHEVIFITIHNESKNPLNRKVRVVQLRMPAPSGYVGNALAVRHILKDVKPSLLHVHQASGYGLLAYLAGFHPYILAVYGADVYDVPRRSRFHRGMVARNLEAADTIMSTSVTMKDHVASSFGISASSIAVIPSGVDVDRFVPTPKEIRGEVWIGTTKKMETKYGIEYLIRAVAILRDRLKDAGQAQVSNQVRLIIAGGGSLESELMRLAKELRLAKQTSFVGPVPHSQVPDVLSQLDIYCAPSVYESESFGVALVEAAACGIPIVASRIGGIPEVVADGVSGYTVPPKDVDALAEKLLTLIRHPAQRVEMGRAGRALVLARYNWQDNAALLEDLYRKVAAA